MKHELNITKGEWFEDGWHIMTNRKSQHTGVGYSKQIATVENAGTGEAEANAILITDAGNTYQSCGLTPSELLKQRDELKKALSDIANQLSSSSSDLQIVFDMRKIARETLKNCE